MNRRYLVLYVISGLVSILTGKSVATQQEDGALAYTQCIGCHSFAYHRTGPKHCNLMGRIAGTAEGYEYSEAMRNSDIEWDKISLNEFLASPLTYVPGTSMGFVGIPDEEKRNRLVEYIEYQSELDQCNP